MDGGGEGRERREGVVLCVLNAQAAQMRCSVVVKC